jgi:hypothetical protein
MQHVCREFNGGKNVFTKENYQKYWIITTSFITSILATVHLCGTTDDIMFNTVRFSSTNLKIIQHLKVFW